MADVLVGDYNNTYHYSGTVGSTAQVTFSGTQMTLMFQRVYNRGALNVMVDGVQVGTANPYDPGVLLQQQWTSGAYSSCAHTLQLIHSGAAPAWISTPLPSARNEF